MENFILTISCLLIGIGLKKIPAFHEETGNVLNLFVIYVSLPAVVLLKIPQLEVSSNLLVPTLMPWVMLVISCLAILTLAKILGWSKGVTGAMLLVIPLGNTSFFGVPMVQTFFGDHAIPYAVLYDQLGSFLALATYGSVVVAIYGSGDKTPQISDVVKRICTFPPFIALLLSFAIRFVHVPDVAISLLEMLGATLIPLVMVAVGFQLSFKLEKQAVSQLMTGLSFKLVAAPLIAMVLCRLLGLQGEIVNVSIFEAGMPPMVSAGALAILGGMAPKLTAAMVGFGIMLSFITLPLLFQLL